MNMLILFLVLGLGVIVNSKTIANTTKDKHQCEYNGQKYNEGEEILAARRICLSCKCTKDFIEPSDYNCSVIECTNIEPLQRGCMPIYSDLECCPIDYNCTGAQPLTAKCDKRYFQHYELKGCHPVFENDAKCPVRFDCPKMMPQNESVCTFGGKFYQLGEPIDVGNPCQICSCREKYPSGVHIDCIFVECPHVFGPPLNDTCYNMYEADKCCPSKTQCAEEGASSRSEDLCEYDGKHYHRGELIYPEGDPCQVCLCNEKWTGIKGNSCRSHGCELELKRDQLLEGCIPIYHEATCCPIEIFCGPAANTTVSLAKKEDIDSLKTCVYQGKHYNLGQTLNINHPTNCVTCTCTTPPEFTCIHKRCPSPPNNDYENCMISYTPGTCCPTYDCKTVSAPVAAAPVPIVHCSSVMCPKGCSEVTVHNSCPFCMCRNKICAPPKCNPGCTVQKTVPQGECPTCECPSSIASVPPPACAPVKCPGHCFEVRDPSGCSVCMCGPVCTPPKCEPECKLQRDVPDGECPRCNCPQNQEITGQLQCSPVKCLAGCIERVGESGCPSCECKPMCSPPKCEAGCYLNPFPTGPCPECVCEDKESIPQLLCSPVHCGPLCHEAYDKDGCGTCICDPQCTVPVCENDCQLVYDAKIGPCPTCICEKNKACPIVTCGPRCEKQIGSDGCPTCSCNPLCSAPKCESGCHLEYDRTAGPCPACVCPDPGVPLIQCSMPKCEEGCQVDYNAKPCPSCVCGDQGIPLVQCSTPKCDAGCQIDYNSKPCPSCTCKNLEIPLTPCSPVKCDPGCKVDYTTTPCPSCKCADILPRTLQCSQPKCDVGCTIDYDAKPCPACKCDKKLRKSPIQRVRCAPVKCPTGCQENYTTRPCPSCSCNKTFISDIQCSPPRCGINCRVDYETKPCPRCVCDSLTDAMSRIRCSPLKCPYGCYADYSVKPCPKCTCDNEPTIPLIMCSPPKCDEGCKIDYSTKPCPSCSCDNEDIPMIACSPPKCDPPCTMDYSTKPCPSCSCLVLGIPVIACSPPKCEPSCKIDYSTKPCPSCSCDAGLPSIMCSPVKCDQPGCKINYSSKPCPSCECETPDLTGLPSIMCSPVKCDEPGCTINYSSKPCPSCECNIPGSAGGIHCSPVKCDSGCVEVTGDHGCPYCDCKPQCSVPKCDPGCHLDSNAKPCPTCVCDRFYRRYASLQVPGFMIHPDPFCRTLSCGSGCTVEQNSNSTERCPPCICDGRVGEKLKCLAMRCEWPCQFKRFSPYGCPTCVCHQFNFS